MQFLSRLRGSRADLCDEHAVSSMFYALLGRFPEPAERRALSGKTPSDVRLTLAGQPEFSKGIGRLMGLARRRKLLEHHGDTGRFYDLIQSAKAPSMEEVDRLMCQFTHGGEYFDYHRERFRELHAFVGVLNAASPIKRLLEISTMSFTTNVWRRYIPDVVLTTVDLPEEWGGRKDAHLEEWGVNQNLRADLNVGSLDDVRDALCSNGKHDLVMATEIVEHIHRDIREFVKFCLDCMTDNGIGIITTPNYLAPWRMEILANGRSPQQRFLNFNFNRGGHYHFREYTMDELLTSTHEAGGKVLGAVYSKCWEPNLMDHRSLEVDLRDNLVLVFAKPSCQLRPLT